MSSWPTQSTLKAAFAVLDNTALNGKIDRAITHSINLILSRLTDHYDTAAWLAASTTVPPAVAQLAYTLAYATVTEAAHTGASTSGSSTAGQDALRTATTTLDAMASGLQRLTDDAGNLIAFRTHATAPDLTLPQDRFAFAWRNCYGPQ